MSLSTAHIDRAEAYSGPDRFTLTDFWLNYKDLDLKPWMHPRGMRIKADIVDLGRYLEYYGVPGMHTGGAHVDVRAYGPVLAPQAFLELDVDTLDFEGRFDAERLTSQVRLDHGLVHLDELTLNTGTGMLKTQGFIDAFIAHNAPIHDLEYVPKEAMSAQIDTIVHRFELGLLRPFLPQQLKGLWGRVNGNMHLRGTLQEPVVCAMAGGRNLSLLSQPIKRFLVRAGFHAKGTEQGCSYSRRVSKVVSGKRKKKVSTLNLSRVSLDLGKAGRVAFQGAYGLEDESISFVLDGQSLDLGDIRLLQNKDMGMDGHGDVYVHGQGSLSRPDIGGTVRMRDLRVLPKKYLSRPLLLGDASFVLNTMVEQFDGLDGGDPLEFREIHAVGALRPWFSIHAVLPVDLQNPASVRLGLEHLNMFSLMDRVGLSKATSYLSRLKLLKRFRVTGTVDAFYDFKKGDYSVNANIPSLELGPSKARLHNKGPILLGYSSVGVGKQHHESLNIESKVGIGAHFIEARGNIDPNTWLYDMQLDGRVNLRGMELVRILFPDLLPESVVEADGSVRVNANFQKVSTTHEAVASGKLIWDSRDQSSVQLRTFADPITVQKGEAHLKPNCALFRDNSLRLVPSCVIIDERNPVKGVALGGNYEVTGDMEFHDYDLLDTKLKMWASNMSYNIAGMVNFTFGTGDKTGGKDRRLLLEAQDLFKYETWKVSGKLVLLDGLYYENMSFLEERLTGRVLSAFNRKAKVFESSFLERYPGFSDTVFDLSIEARDGLRLKNRIDRFDLDLEFRLALLLADTLNDPSLKGDVEVIDGTVIFQGEKFDVQDGVVRFAGDPSSPFIDIRAGADIRNACKGNNDVNTDINAGIGLSSATSLSEANQDDTVYHIVLNVRGDPNSLDLLYESTPYADQRDVISLILTGCTVDLLTASSASQPTLEIALGPLIGRLEREIQDVVKVEEFSIMPGLERTQFRIGDKLFKRISWGFQLDAGFNNSSTGTVVVGYELTDQWSLKASWRQQQTLLNSNTLLDTKLTFSVPLD